MRVWLGVFVLIVEGKLAVSLNQRLGSVLFVGSFIVHLVVLRWDSFLKSLRVPTVE